MSNPNEINLQTALGLQNKALSLGYLPAEDRYEETPLVDLLMSLTAIDSTQAACCHDDGLMEKFYNDWPAMAESIARRLGFPAMRFKHPDNPLSEKPVFDIHEVFVDWLKKD